MKRMALLLSVSVFAMIGLPGFALDDCPFCTAHDKVGTTITKVQAKQKEVKLDDGMMLVLLTRNETDGKAVQQGARDFQQVVMKGDITKACAMCKDHCTVMRQAMMEVLPSKNGVVVMLTSSDPAVVKKLHAMMGGASEEKAEMADHEEKAEKVPVAFEGKGDGVKTCPVMGTPVKEAIFVEYKGRNVYFCCQSCVRQFKASPEKYLKVE